MERPTIQEAISDIQEKIKALEDHEGVNRKAIVVLLNHSTKIPQRVIVSVLDGFDDLLIEYCRDWEAGEPI